MRLSPRAKLVALMALFAVPIVASIVAYNFADVRATSNYGELILPPQAITTQSFARIDGVPFVFSELRGRWVMVASDSGDCAAACLEKLTTMRQVRLALGRNAARVERVFVVDDTHAPATGGFDAFPGMVVAVTPKGLPVPSGAANDRAAIYLVDPNGNVMMRWPAHLESRRMLKDLERLLKASQIG